jgi:hypothetical protein
MRSPAGTGSCVAIISFTLVIAAGVSETGWAFGAPVTTSAVGVTVAVDMGNLLYTSASSVYPPSFTAARQTTEAPPGAQPAAGWMSFTPGRMQAQNGTRFATG